MRPHCGWDEAMCQTESNSQFHEEFHHAGSMNEIQKALKEGRQVLDPDGDKITKAVVRRGHSKTSSSTEGHFTLVSYGTNFKYTVNKILVEDEPVNEEEIMKSLLASLERSR